VNNNHWKILCERVNDLIEIGVTNEDPFHNALEKELKNIYNWPPQHIKHKPPVKIGSETKYPDIVLEGDGFGIIIEVKAPGVILGDDQAGQLISYMNNYFTDRNSIKCKYGLLIGGEIKVYFQDDPNKKPQLITSFGFDIDSPDGNALSEILFYDECSDEKLMEYMYIRIKQQKDKEQEKNLKKELLADDGTKIKEILKNKLISDGLDEEIICNILNDIVIKLKNETGENGPTPPPPPPPSNNFLDEVMNYYNSICDQNFKFNGNQKIYRNRAIIENEKQLHYEFLDRRRYMGIEIHKENMRFIKLNDIISSFTGKNIRGYTIEPMSRGVKISVPYNAGKEECSLVMKELINLTYEKIRDEYKKLKL